MASTSQPSESYAYQHLEKGHIRVLGLASTDDNISGSLRSIALKSLFKRQKYYALSYTWGSSLITHPFECDGKNLPIRTNLRDALPMLLGLGKPLWIDAVCINQADESEKVWQIQLMSTIYKSASKVLVWLGQATPDTNYTLLHQTDLLAVLKKLKYATEAQSIDARFLRGIGSLLTRGWWSRLWTLQEAALASSMVFLCGTHQIMWSDLYAIARHVVRLDIESACRGTTQQSDACDGFGEVFNIKRVSQTLGHFKSTDFEPLLHAAAQRRDCFDPIDRIYGILGLMPSSGLLGCLSWDADGTDTVEDIYMYFTGVMVAERIDIRGYVLSLNETAVRREVLPSWCPDYHQKPVAITLADYLGYHACLTSVDTKTFHFDPEKRTISTEASVIDQVAELIPGSWSSVLVTPVPPLNITANISFMRACAAAIDDFDACDHLWEALLGGQITYDNPKGFGDMYLLGHGRHYDRIESRRFSKEASSLRTAYHALLPALLEVEARVSQETIDFPPEITAYIKRIERICLNRRFVTTTSGKFGLAPLATQPGDSVVVMRNVNVPFVLRNMQIDGNRWEHIYPCRRVVHSWFHAWGMFEKQASVSQEDSDLVDRRLIASFKLK